MRQHTIGLEVQSLSIVITYDHLDPLRDALFVTHILLFRPAYAFAPVLLLQLVFIRFL